MSQREVFMLLDLVDDEQVSISGLSLPPSEHFYELKRTEYVLAWPMTIQA